MTLADADFAVKALLGLAGAVVVVWRIDVRLALVLSKVEDMHRRLGKVEDIQHDVHELRERMARQEERIERFEREIGGGSHHAE